MSNAALSSDPYEHGLRLAAAGRHGEAIGSFETALGRNPNDGRVLFALGNTARALGMGDAAEQFYRQVLTVEPGRIEAEISLSNLLRAGGQMEAAEAIVSASPRSRLPRSWPRASSGTQSNSTKSQSNEILPQSPPTWAPVAGSVIMTQTGA